MSVLSEGDSVDQIGIVLANESEGWARVATDRKRACGGCHTSLAGCRSCLSTAKMESRVANPVNAQAGDLVKISLPSADLLKGAALLYLLPVAALLAGALGGGAAASALGWPQTPGAVGGGIAGLALAVWAVIRLDRSRWARRRLVPAITAIIAEGQRDQA